VAFARRCVSGTQLAQATDGVWATAPVFASTDFMELTAWIVMRTRMRVCTMIVPTHAHMCACGRPPVLRTAAACQTVRVNVLAITRVNTATFVFLISTVKIVRRCVTTMRLVVPKVIVTHKVFACATMALLEIPVKLVSRQHLEKIAQHSATGKLHAVHMAAVLSTTTSTVRALEDTLESIVPSVHSDWHATNMTQNAQTKGVILIE
jgi:hypothetical protein